MQMPQHSGADPEHFTSAGKPPLVFLGPTLPLREAAALLAASFRPPVRRGDIYRALADGFTTLVVIDGEFHGVPSVWQREIAEALAEGATVHGASSMGAIRAAELRTLGMIGHGRIFEWYRDGAIVADDEVALGHGPPEFGYPALSEPLVNIRATLAAAPSDILGPDERDQLIEFSCGLYYLERSLEGLVEKGPAANWPSERRRALRHFLRHWRIDQKREDALVALRSIAAGRLAHSLPSHVPDARTPWRRERLIAEGLIPVRQEHSAEIARRVGLSQSELAGLRRKLSTLFFVALWGEERGLTVTESDLARQRAVFPAAAGIPVPRLNALLASRALTEVAVREFSSVHAGTDPSSLMRAIVLEWARCHGITHPGYAEEVLAEWVIESSPVHFGYKWSFEIELTETMWLLGHLRRSQPGEAA